MVYKDESNRLMQTLCLQSCINMLKEYVYNNLKLNLDLDTQDMKSGGDK